MTTRRPIKCLAPLLGLTILLALPASGPAAAKYPTDFLKTSGGPLRVTFIGHGSVMFTFKGKVIHVDPFSRMGDYRKLPKADLILVTHHHRDHFDKTAIKAIGPAKTRLIATATVAPAMVMKPGDVKTVLGLKIEAMPAYNVIRKRPISP